MTVTLISPRIAVQKGDFLGSGVPYWPLELAILAAFLRDRNVDVSVIDMFGSDPKRLEERADHYLQGAYPGDYINSNQAYFKTTDLIIIYALSYMSHQDVLCITRICRKEFPRACIAILENSQAVTAYSLPHVAGDFFGAGADALLCGEVYFNWDEIQKFLLRPEKARVPSNVLVEGSDETLLQRKVEKYPKYPIPAWDLFNYRNYWSIPYSHGPKSGQFFPVFTSRGCPYPCDFCVVPETNSKRWRGRDPVEVVEEMLFLRDKFGVKHFQIEDLNPTVRRDRWEKICDLLIERNAGINFYIVSGTKAETVRIEQVERLAKAGCKYISISPESGSKDVLKAIGKRFNHEHGLQLIEVCRQYGIRTQACILVGHPAETEADYLQSKRYLEDMVKAGLDEVAIFIVASFAGSNLYEKQRIEQTDNAALPSFSPKGRDSYMVFNRRRQVLIKTFFKLKLRQGLELWKQAMRSLFGHPQTKMENLPRRIVFILCLIVRYKWNHFWGRL